MRIALAAVCLVACSNRKPAVPDASPVLVDESFASIDSLASWQKVMGARTGEGDRASEVGWDDGALRLAGDPGTVVWTSLTREVDVPAGAWVRLHGRMRTEGVTPGTHGDCNLYLKYAGGLVPTRPLAGTNAWTEVGRRFELPPGTTRVTVGLFLDAPGTAWFDDVRLELTPPPAWSEAVDGPYHYLTLPGDSVPAEALRYNAESVRLVSELLGVPAPAVVEYRKYPDLATKEELSGRGGNAHREGQVIHSIFATDRHEIVHVLADAWGDPPALLGEGLAVYLSGGWQGRPVKAYAADLIAKGAWVAPSSILSTAAFRARPDLTTYAVAGAFVEWVATVHGKDTLKELYGALKNQAGEPDNRAELERVLGGTIEEIDAAVAAWVSS